MANPREGGMRVPEEFVELIEQRPQENPELTVSKVQQEVAKDPRSTVHQAERTAYVIDREIQD